MEHKQSAVIEYFVLAIFTILFFCPSLKNGFVWDDKDIIFKQIQHIEGLNIYKPSSIYYRPLTQISFLLDYLIWGYRPFGYHLTNIILHTANVLLFFILIRKILTKLEVEPSAPFLLALVFALHPVHVESVSWIAGRTDILVSLFSLLTLIATQLYWERGEKRLFIFILIFFLLALASKEMAVILVPILLIEGIWIAPMLYRPQRDRFFNICLLLIIGIAIVYMFSKLPGFRIYGWHFNPLSLIRTTGFYLKSLIFPWPFYSYMPYIPTWGIWIGPIFLTIGAVIFLKIYKYNRLQAQIGLVYSGIFFISLLPIFALPIFHIGATPVAWRYLYMPSIFFILGVGIWLIKTKKAKFILLGVCFCLFLITITHQSIWRDDFHFWQKAITMANKDYAIPHHEYALALWERGDLKGAERHFIFALKAKDIQAYPWEKAIVYTNLGRLYASQKRWKRAQVCFKKALWYNPKYKPALCNLGKLYYILYQKTNKEKLWEKAQKLLKECP